MSRESFARILESTQTLKVPKGLGTSRKTDIDRWIREPEVRQLLLAAKTGHERWAPAAYDSLLFTANLGLRASEVVDMILPDFKSLGSHNAIIVRSSKSRKKNPLRSKDLLRMDPREFARLQAVMAQEAAEVRPKKIDTVYVSDAERDLFLEAVARRRLIAQRDPYMRLFPFSKRQFQYLFNYYRGRAGLREGLSPHALRRFVATRLTQLTGERRLATARLRHHEASVTMGYVDFPPETQIALLNKVEPVW